MAKKSGGRGARGGRQGENRDIGHVKYGRREFTGGGNSVPLCYTGNAFASTSSGEMTPEQRIYSLQDEARNTERQRSSARSDNRLRNQKIAFVSAGHFDAKNLMELDTPDIKDTQNTGGLTGKPEDSITLLEDSLVKTGLHEVIPPAETDRSMSDFKERLGIPPQSYGEATVIIQGNCGTINTSNPDEPGNSTQVDPTPQVARTSSPTPSDSSQELILFNGRDYGTNVAKEQMARRPTSSSTLEESYRRNTSFSLDSDGHGVGSGESPFSETIEITGRRFPSRRRKIARDKEQETIIDDYIANLKEHGDMEGLVPNETYRTRELGGIDMGGWRQNESENELSTAESRAAVSKSVVSASTNALGDIDSILAKRSRQNSDQFLVQFKGYSINEVKWIPRTYLATESQLKHVAAFEGPRGPELDAYGTADSDNIEVWMKEEKLQQRKASITADAALSRRDDFGLSSDRFLGLVDSDETISDGYMLDAEGPIPSLFSKTRKAPCRKGRFPSATRVADAYDDFDIMDLERPSLNRGKARRTALTFNFSDSELEDNLFSRWERDRKKKAEKKKQRAELHAQGVLGKYNATNPNMRAKYEAGMTADDVEHEIIQFLASDREQLAFPFMDKPQRKMLHEIGNFLGLKSKSAGSKKRRFTTLYKTSISIIDPTDIQHIFTAIRARGFVWCMGTKSKERRSRATKTSEARPPRRSWATDTTPKYRDGEIVGAAAPELGTENKGRQMLEKMGWSSGTALGALNNKGILQPVATVIKTSKAGLG